MTDNKTKSDRQFAASLTRKYFGGQISKHELFDNFPDHNHDIKLSRLYKAIEKEPTVKRFFGAKKEEHTRYVLQTYKLIEDLENTKLIPEIMFRLFKELCFASGNCSHPIENIGIRLMEVAKSTYNTRDDIWEYLNELIKQGHVEISSQEPLLFTITDKGKTVKTLEDTERIVNNASIELG